MWSKLLQTLALSSAYVRRVDGVIVGIEIPDVCMPQDVLNLKLGALTFVRTTRTSPRVDLYRCENFLIEVSHLEGFTTITIIGGTL